jgi:hypothetical protein
MVVARPRTALAVITLLLGVVSASAQTIEQNRKMCGDAAARRIDPDVEATPTKSGRILCGGALP